MEIHCLATVWCIYTLLILVCRDLRLYMTCSQRRRRVERRIGLKLWQVWAGFCIGYLSQKGGQNNANLEWKEMKHGKTMLLINLQNSVQLRKIFSGSKNFLYGLVFGVYSNALSFMRSQGFNQESSNGSHFSRFSPLLHNLFAIINYNIIAPFNLWILYHTSF